MLKRAIIVFVAGVFLVLISCGGGGGSGIWNGNPLPPNQDGGNQSAAFVNTVTATSTEVSPGEIVIIKAVTTAPGPTFTWRASAGAVLSQLDGSSTAGPFSMLWWKAPSTGGTISLVTVTVNSSAGSLETSIGISANPATAVSGEWRSFNGDSENTGRTSSGAIEPNNLDLIWKVGLSAPSRAPVAAVTDGIVFAGDSAGSVVAADAVTGSVRWTSALTGEVVASPIVGGGKVYFSTTGGDVVAFDAVSGQQLWTFSTGGSIFSSPTYIDGLLMVATQDGVLFALRTQKTIANRSDRIWWVRNFENEHIVAPVAQSQPNPKIEAARTSTVYVATREGNVYAVRAADGSILWRRQVQGMLLHSPVVFPLGASRWIGVVTEQGNVYIWNAATGDAFGGRSPYLTISQAVSAAPAFMDGKLFFSSRTGTLYAVDLFTGNYVMSATLPENVGCFATPALISQGAGRLPTAFYPCFEILDDAVDPPNEFTNLRGVIYRVEQATGGAAPRIQRMFATGWTNRPFYPSIQDHQEALIGASAIHTVAVPQARGRLYFAGVDGALYALGDSDVAPATPPEWPMKRLNTLNNGYYEQGGQGGGPGRGVLNLLWTQTVNARVTGSPIVARNMLLIGHWNKKLEAFRANDGLKLWEFLADESLRGTPVISANGDIAFYTNSSQLIVGRMDGNRFVQTVLDAQMINMFIGTRTRIFVQDDDDDPATPPVPRGGHVSSDVGRPPDEVWSAVVSSAPLVVNNQLYVYLLHPTYSETYTLDSEGNVTNITRTQNQRGSAYVNVLTGGRVDLQDIVPTSSPIVLDTGQIVFAGFDGWEPGENASSLGTVPVMVRLDPSSNQVARLTVGTSGDIIAGTPAFTDGIIFVASRGGQLFAINAQSTPMVRMSGVPSLPPGATVQGNVAIYPTGPNTGMILFGADDGRLYAYDYTVVSSNALSMNLRWTFVTGAPVWSSPAIDPRNFVVYFGSNDKNFYAVDLITGVELWRFTSGDRFIASAAITGGKVFTVDEGGRIYAFGR